jgi:hypothetical protein
MLGYVKRVSRMRKKSISTSIAQGLSKPKLSTQYHGKDVDILPFLHVTSRHDSIPQRKTKLEGTPLKPA